MRMSTAAVNRLFGFSLKNIKCLLSVNSCHSNNLHACNSTVRRLKKPATGFAAFVQQEGRLLHEQLKSEEGYTNSSRMKRLSELWHDLSTEQKESYNAPVEKWDEYRSNMESLQMLTNYEFIKAINQVKQHWNLPKKPASAYLCFVKSSFEDDDVQKIQDPKARIAHIAKKWKDVSEEEKEVYQQKSEKDVEVYFQKMFIWEEEMKSKGMPELCRDYVGQRRRALLNLLRKLDWEKDEQLLKKIGPAIYTKLHRK